MSNHVDMYYWDGTNFVPWGGTVTAASASGGTVSIAGTPTVSIPGTPTVSVSGTVPTSQRYAKGTPANTQAAPGTTSTLVLAANANRMEAVFVNAGSITAYLGGSPAIAGTSLYFPPGATLVDDRGTVAWHGITSSGTADIRVMEYV